MTGLVETFSQVGIVAGALVAVFTALVMAARKVHEVGRWLHEINTVVNKELTRNGGASMKDQIHTIGRKLDDAKQDVARLQGTVDTHLSDSRAHWSDPAAHRHNMDDDG